MDDRFWPRTLAVAEVGGTAENLRDFSGFKKRSKDHGPRLQEMGIHYFPTPEIDLGTWEIAEKPASLFSQYDPEVR